MGIVYPIILIGKEDVGGISGSGNSHGEEGCNHKVDSCVVGVYNHNT